MLVVKRAVNQSVQLGDGSGGLMTITNKSVNGSGHLTLEVAVEERRFLVTLPLGATAPLAEMPAFAGGVEMTNVRPGLQGGSCRIGLTMPAHVVLLDERGHPERKAVQA